MALLAIPDRISSHLRHPPIRRDGGDAAPHLYLPARPRTRHAEPDRVDRSGPASSCGTHLDNQRHKVAAFPRIGGRLPMGRVDARMVDDFTATRVQLRVA